MTTTAHDDVATDDAHADGRGTYGAGRAFSWLLVICGALGVLAAFVITQDKLELLKDPNFKPACSLSPVVSCTDVMNSWQAEVFGFPNPVAGLVTYGALIAIGMGLVAGARYRKWFWIGLNIGTLLGAVFCMWLMTQAYYDIRALCLWCVLAWIVTIAAFWYTTVHNLKHRIIPAPEGLRGVLLEFHWVVPVLWYGLILLLTLTNWWSYWSTLI